MNEGSSPINLSIEWSTPLTASELDDQHELLSKAGLYLWVQNRQITYVGEAGCFYDRFLDHFRCMVDGRYCFWDLQSGEKPYDYMEKDGSGKPQNHSKFVSNHPRISSIIDEQRIRQALFAVNETTFVFGTANELADQLTRQEIEGGIISQLCSHWGLRRSRTTPIGRVNRTPKSSYVVKHDGDGSSEVQRLLAETLDGDRTVICGQMKS